MARLCDEGQFFPCDGSGNLHIFKHVQSIDVAGTCS